MNSDGDDIYIKFVILDEIYNFVVQTFFIGSNVDDKIIDTSSRSKFNFICI